MHPDQADYFSFTRRSRLDKSINTLSGIIEGITLDGQINKSESDFLLRWLSDYQDAKDLHPFCELMPLIQAATTRGLLDEDAREDILWLCKRMRSTEYYDAVTADMQRLHGVIGGIVADGIITEAELRGLSTWLSDHQHLRTCWPYDEIDSLVTTVMADKIIDDSEQKLLREFFSEFIHIADERTINAPSIQVGTGLVGLCAVCPEILFTEKRFCFTGSSNRFTRDGFISLVESLGGKVSTSLTSTVSYLVIGAEGNPCWAYACYGRKVEKAVELRKSGSRLLIIHENDFHDAIADNR